MSDETRSVDPTAMRVHGMPLEDVLVAVWFDGFTSGAATGCGVFLPGKDADAKADELAVRAAKMPGMREQVRTEVRERAASLMRHVEASGQEYKLSRMSDAGE